MNTGQMVMMKTLARPFAPPPQFTATVLPEEEQKTGRGFAGLLGGMQGAAGQKSNPQRFKTSPDMDEDAEWKDIAPKSAPQNAEANAAGQMILTAVQQQNRMNETRSKIGHEVDAGQNVPVNKVAEQQLSQPVTASVGERQETAGVPAPETLPSAQPVGQMELAALPVSGGDKLLISGIDKVQNAPVNELPEQQQTPPEETPISPKTSAPMAPAIKSPAMQVVSQTDTELQAGSSQLQNQQIAVRELTASLSNAITASDSAFASGDLLDDGSNQSAQDQRFSGQMMAPQVYAQPKTEINTAAQTFVSENSVRQDLSEQVAQQVKDRLTQHELKAGNQQIKLTLSPDNLGELKINLNLFGQKLSVEIVTENRMVRDAILQNTDALKESLARQNISMESFDVTTGDKGSGSGSRGQNSNAWRELADQQQQRQQFWAAPPGFQTMQAGIPPDLVAYQNQHGYSMLDIHY